MRSIKESYDYDSVALTDEKGAVTLSTSDGEELDTPLFQYLPQAAQEKKPIVSTLYREGKENSIRLAVLSPILDRSKEGTPVVGFLVLRIDPYRFLYPFVQSWPTPSQTSETLLVRREGGDVLYLNELRHRKGSALSLKMELDDDDLPAALLLRGKEGMTEGMDYRGVPVLASLRRIPDSPWSLVAKQDIEEVYQPIRERARIIALLVALLIGSAGICLFLILSYQRAAMLEKTRSELETKVHERTMDLARANEWLREQAALLELAHDAILVRDMEERITYWNHGAEETYGWKKEETLGRVIHELLGAESPEPLDRIKEKVVRTGQWQGELRHLTRSGIPIIVESRWALQSDQEGNPAGILEINRDVTSRCKVEEELRLDEARFEALYKMSQMVEAPEREIIDFALEEQIRLTRSKIGSIDFLNEDETIAEIRGWSGTVMKECEVGGYPDHFPVAQGGIWAEAVRKREPIIVNDYSKSHPAMKGYPEGHMELSRFMSVPNAQKGWPNHSVPVLN
jgi:PAS domain S-box-containing protein